MAIARRLGLKIDPHTLVGSLVRVAASLARKCMICLAHRGLGRSASTASAKLWLLGLDRARRRHMHYIS
jgi:hypothetical protein